MQLSIELLTCQFKKEHPVSSPNVKYGSIFRYMLCFYPSDHSVHAFLAKPKGSAWGIGISFYIALNYRT